MRAALLTLVTAVGPVSKVIQLLDELAEKVTKDGEAEQAEFTEFTRWCASEQRGKGYSISTAKRSINDLTATAESADAAIDKLQTKVGELSTAISSNEDEAAKATEMRTAEKKQFETTDSELTETVDTLVRAQATLGQHAKEASLEEVKANLGKVTMSLTQIVQASWVNTDQKEVIESFLQKSKGDDDLSFAQQPQASVSSYESHGGGQGGLLETLADLQAKAEAAQAESRREETQARHAYDLLAASLKAELKAQTKQLEDAKKSIATHQEAKSAAEGDLSATTKTLNQDEKVLGELKMECQEKAQEFDATSASRMEELKTLKEAKRVLESGVPAPAPSFIQLSEAQDEQQRETAVQYLQRLAHELNSMSLAQVAVSLGGDSFGKVKGMIEAMIAKLMSEQSEAADRKSWCDDEMSKTGAARSDKERKLEVSNTRIEKVEATSAKLAEAVNHLQHELAEMDVGQAEATKLRQTEHANFLAASQDYSDGQQACAGAINVLRQYYEGDSFLQTPNTGTAHSIIGLLEVAESDFSRMEADSRAVEAASQQAYDQQTQEHQVTKAAKTAEVNAKTAEMTRLAADGGNYKSDRQDVSKELDAVLQYEDKLKSQCQTTAPSYEERSSRRKQELEGLQNALMILDGKALALIGSSIPVRKASLRGA